MFGLTDKDCIELRRCSLANQMSCGRKQTVTEVLVIVHYCNNSYFCVIDCFWLLSSNYLDLGVDLDNAGLVNIMQH